jgi:transposase
MSSSIGQVDQVLGIDGGVLTAADLPPRTLKRWIARRKAEVIAAVEGGLLSESEACARYNISSEEFSAWLHAYDHDGVPGLRARAKAPGMRRRNRDEAEFRTAAELMPLAGLG